MELKFECGRKRFKKHIVMEFTKGCNKEKYCKSDHAGHNKRSYTNWCKWHVNW